MPIGCKRDTDLVKWRATQKAHASSNEIHVPWLNISFLSDILTPYWNKNKKNLAKVTRDSEANTSSSVLVSTRVINHSKKWPNFPGSIAELYVCVDIFFFSDRRAYFCRCEQREKNPRHNRERRLARAQCVCGNGFEIERGVVVTTLLWRCVCVKIQISPSLMDDRSFL